MVYGRPIARGRALFGQPCEQRPWTVIFIRAAHVFHKPYPGPAEDVLRVDVAPESLSHVETMAIDFPNVLRTNAVMRIH